MGYRVLKRFFDIIVSVILLAVFLIPLLIFMVVIRLTSEGTAIFRQERIGRNGKTFVCLKLRTMYIDAPKNIATAKFLNAESYITPVGRFLRRTSLDELPQLINVLMGDMSLVGPRPLIPEELDMHRQRRAKGVYSIRPGMTGLAQVKGRDSLNDGEKLALDVEYLNNMGVFLDIKILFSTLVGVATGKGVEDGEKEKRLKG